MSDDKTFSVSVSYTIDVKASSSAQAIAMTSYSVPSEATGVSIHACGFNTGVGVPVATNEVEEK